MDDTVEPRGTVRVTTCADDATLALAADLFNRYRHHFGEPPDEDGRTVDWLTGMVRSDMLTVYTASADSSGHAVPIGLATGHAVPASLAMGRFWQLRDLYVLPGHRGRGTAAALVGAVRAAALAAGASRLSLETELDNDVALSLYGKLGFERVEGFTSLSLDLRPDGTP